MSFLKVFLATILGFFTSLLLIALLVVGVFTAIIATIGSEDVVHVRKNSVLEIDLAKRYAEYNSTEGFAELAGGGASISLRELVAAIETAADDSRISGIRLKATGRPGSWAAAEAIRRAIEEFRTSGKFVIATIAEHGISEGSYFIASAADSIVAVPSADVEINGIAAALPFMKPALDRLGIDAQVVRAGSFKSAVEPFILDSASAETQLMMREIVDGTFDRFRSVVARARGISPAQLGSIIATRAMLTAHEARAAGLVDAVLFDDQIDSLLRRLTNVAGDDELETISVGEYAAGEVEEDGPGARADRIAVVYAVGEITTGESSSRPNPLSGGETLGSETFVEAMESARESKAVKAVVVRIDSPGGEAGASETMWRAIKLTAATKPVIASMGATAASGGYYIAAACDTIVAEPATITGSIGVFGLWFTVAELMRDKLGINVQVIRSDSLADLGSMLRVPTDRERAILQRGVDTVYAKFLKVVSDGRGISVAEADRIGQGRVYTGARAQELKLVDELGGLERAVEIAASRAGLKADQFRLRILPERRSFVESLMSMFDQTSVMSLLGLGGDPGSLIEAELERRNGVQMLGPSLKLGVE